MDISSIKNRATAFLDSELLMVLSEGKEAFEPGVYEVYLAEAARRGMQIPDTVINGKAQRAERTRKDEGKVLVYTGYLLLVVFFGIFSIIPASIVKFKKIDGEHYYTQTHRFHANIQFILSIAAWVISAIALISTLLSP